MPMTETVPALLERHLAERPDDVAFLEGDRRISYREFAALCGKTAAWLADQDIAPGDRVAVWLVNRIEWLALLFGLARIEAALVALNTRYRAAELQTVLDRSGARMLVLQHNFRKIDFPAVLQGVDAGALPALEGVAVVDCDASTPSQILGRPTIPFQAFARGAGETADRSRPAAPGRAIHDVGHHERPQARGPLAADDRLSQPTGGGRLRVRRARRVPARGDTLLRRIRIQQRARRVRRRGAGRADGDLRGRPRSGARPAAPRHARLRQRRDVSPDARARSGARSVSERPVVRLCRVQSRRRGLRSRGLGQARSARRPLRLERGAGPLLGAVAVGPVPAADRGRRAARGGSDAEIRVRDVDTGDLLPPGQSGEIEIRAPSNFVGYWNNPAATADAVGRDGFFRTGDIGQLRADGTFLYETRRGDAIRLGGYLVSPTEIEEALKRIPGVGDVQVVAVEIAGQPRAVAFVVPAAGAAPREADVIAAAAAQMAGFKVPARVWFVDEFPTTDSPNGLKIQRARLRDMALEHLSRDARDSGAA